MTDRTFTPEERASLDGLEAAERFAGFLTDDNMRTLLDHGPARLLDQLVPVQDERLPESDYLDLDDDLHDAWATEFWITLESLATVRLDSRRASLSVPADHDVVEFHFVYGQEPDDIDDDALAHLCADMLFDQLVDGVDLTPNTTVTRADG